MDGFSSLRRTQKRYPSTSASLSNLHYPSSTGPMQRPSSSVSYSPSTYHPTSFHPSSSPTPPPPNLPTTTSGSNNLHYTNNSSGRLNNSGSASSSRLSSPVNSNIRPSFPTSSGYNSNNGSGYGSNNSSGYGANNNSGYGSNNSSGYSSNNSPGYHPNLSSGYGSNNGSGYGSSGLNIGGGYTTIPIHSTNGSGNNRYKLIFSSKYLINDEKNTSSIVLLTTKFRSVF